MSTAVPRIGLALVDDDALARKGLRELIDAQGDMQVTCEAADCSTALRRLDEVGADVVIVEPLLPGMSTTGLLGELQRRGHDTRVVVLTRSESADDVVRLVRAGADAYLRKSATPDGLLDTVRAVASGGHVFEPHALDLVLNDYCERCQSSFDGRKVPLSVREREVLTLVTEGLSSREIAAELRLSHKTIEAHRQRIMSKLGLHKVADLVRYAVREGLVGLDTF